MSGCLGHADQVAAVTELIRAQADDSTTVEAKVVAFSRASAELLNAGRYELADALLADIAAIAAVHAITDPVVLARTHDARARRALVLGDLGETRPTGLVPFRCVSESSPTVHPSGGNRA